MDACGGLQSDYAGRETAGGGKVTVCGRASWRTRTDGKE